MTEKITLKGSGEILEGIVIIATGTVLTSSGSNYTGELYGPTLVEEEILENVSEVYTGFQPTLGVEIGNSDVNIELETTTGEETSAWVQLPFYPEYPVVSGQEYAIYSSTDGEIRSFHDT